MRSALALLALLAMPVHALDVVATLDTLVDGDTAWFVVNGERRKVRFTGVDTPEQRARCPAEAVKAAEATEYTGNALQGARKIEIRDYRPGEDFYHRDLGSVWVDGRDLGGELIARGLGRPMLIPHRASWCK